MQTGISVTFAPTPGAARKALSHVRLLGYQSIDLQTFVNTGTDWFLAPNAARRWTQAGNIARDLGLSVSQTHGPWRYPPRDATPEERAERFEKMCAALEGTAAAGAPCPSKPTSAAGCPTPFAANGRKRWRGRPAS